MELGLYRKKAIVTGGSHGIGLSTAIALAKEGCDVAIFGRTQSRLLDAKVKIEKHGVECLCFQADVLDDAAIDRCLEELSDLWISIDILVNNVGGGGRWGLEDIEKTDDNVWEEVYKKNVSTSLKFIKYVLPYMKAQNWGRIVTITSTLGRQAGGRPWFNIAKTAQTCLMKNLSLKKDLVRHNITFNSVAPGCIMIPDTGWEEKKKQEPELFAAMVEDKFPLGRMGTPDEVAYAIIMLCSKSASLINGAALAVDGGESYAF